MQYTPLIQTAVKCATKTHEIHQKQKRKGKDIPYIVHPLAVGLILARAGASEEVVAAGILHDTIEDSVEHKKVTRGMLTERFGEKVATLVDSVTEQNKSLSWVERKEIAHKHIASFSHDSVLVKSADVISNTTEILDDYKQDGEAVFSRFNAPREQIIGHYLKAASALLERWPESPLAADLNFLVNRLKGLAYNEGMDGDKPKTFAEKLKAHSQLLIDGNEKLRQLMEKITEAENKDDAAEVERLLSESEAMAEQLDKVDTAFESTHAREFEALKAITKTKTPPLPELYLDAEQQKKRRIAMVHCEDEGCGFGLEFKHPNCTFFFCKEHGTGFNLDLATVSAAGVECEVHGKMEQYDLGREDNVCPRCERNTLAVLSVGR